MTPERAGKADDPTDKPQGPVEETDADPCSDEVELGKTDETETEAEAVEDSPQILSREDLLDPHQTREPETQVVAGMRIRGLSASEVIEAEEAYKTAARDAKSDNERSAAGSKAEMVMHLTHGVIDPPMIAEEWRHAMKSPAMGAALREVHEAIQDTSGIAPFEVALAKKLLRQTLPEHNGLGSALSDLAGTPQS